jgi:translocation and assembly module TamB
MKLRRFTWMLAAPALLLALGLTAWYWLLHSESGARWLFARLQSSLPASLEMSGLSGDLGSGLQLTGVEYDDGATRLEAGLLKLAVNIDLIPPAVTLESLQAESVAVRPLLKSGGESGPETAIDGLSLPLPLTFPEISITGVEVFDLSGDRTLLVHSIEASGSLHRSLVLDRGSVKIPDKDFSVSGQLGLAAPHPLSLDFQARGDFVVEGKLGGNLESADIEIEAAQPLLSVKGTLQSLLQAPAWDVTVSSSLLTWPLDDSRPIGRLRDLNLESSGEWTDYRLDLSAMLELEGLEPSRLILDGAGTNTGFSAHSLSLQGPELSLGANGDISWENDLQLSLEAALQSLDPRHWLDDWPAGHPVHGELAIKWRGDELEIPGFNLAVGETSFTSSGHGVFDIPAGVVDAELNWTDLNWPPGSLSPVAGSRSGQFRIGGRPEDWTLDGGFFLQAGAVPEGHVKMSGSGDLESLDITIHQAAVLAGEVSGNVRWNWTQSKPFELELSASTIDFTPLFPQYPGTLNTRLAATGELQPFLLRADLQRLDGLILEHPFTVAGGFHIEQDQVFADRLIIESGDSRLSLDGGLYQKSGIVFSANIESMERYSDDLAGTLSAQGELSLHPESPRVSAALSGQQIKLGSIEIGMIETRELAEDAGEPGSEYILTGLMFDDRPVDSLALRMTGREPLREIGLTARTADTEISLVMKGSIKDWTAPLNSGWSGALSELRLNRDDGKSLSLDRAASLEWSTSRLDLEQACFSGPSGGRLCLESSWNSPDEIDVHAELDSISLALLELALQSDARFSQVMSGTVDWSQKSGIAVKGGARIDISPGTIKFEGDDVVLAETGPAVFGFELADGQLRQGDLDLNFPGSGDIEIDFSIPDLSLGPDSPLRGDVRIDLSDIGAIGHMIPMLDTIDGVLDVDIGLSGTLSDPAFRGRAAITGGLIENRASGFSFSEINLAGDVSELDISEMKGSFRAGEGTGEITTNVQFKDILSPEIELSLKGESLTLIDVPDLTIVADPDLELAWRDEKFEIDGSLVIPAARLSPSYLPESSVPQSEDVVVVAGEIPGQKEDDAGKKAFNISGDLEVALGDEVVIDLDVAKVDMTGSATFSWRDELIPMANGAFNASGEIQAFGQFLRITRGRIGFPDIPADNPHLNIRAEREIFGNAQIRRAGLMVAGTLQRPVIEAYTVPMTNKHRAQTLLVTGSDFNYEQGVGAVDVGMYVLPRLYVSYGIGIFEDGNVIKARYELGRGFGITATSGQRETGLDISYTIDR